MVISTNHQRVLLGMRHLMYILPLFMIGSCAKRNVETYERFDICDSAQFNYDAQVDSVRISAFDIEEWCEIELIKWSVPDSAGNQHKEESAIVHRRTHKTSSDSTGVKKYIIAKGCVVENMKGESHIEKKRPPPVKVIVVFFVILVVTTLFCIFRGKS